MNYAGKFDATIAADGPGTHHSPAYVHFDSPHAKVPPDAIVVTDAHLLFNADFKRSGVDLILSKDDAELVLHDYFKGEKRAPLASPDGAHLTGDLVNALTGHVQYSQAGGAAAASHVIGHVTKLAGSATAIRNGVSILLHQGDNVEKGDVVQSGADSTLGITFIDGTVFGLSSNARMVLNEMVYDPNGSNNASLMSLVAGTISFVAGETAKHGDMKVDTPVATMGIRGTAVLVEIDFTVPQGASQPDAKFQVLVEPDGTTGSYILFDKTTLQPIAVVNQAGQQVSINNGVVSTSASQLSPDLQKLITDVFQQKFAANDSNTKLTQHTDSTNPDLFNGQLIKTASGATATPVFLVTGTALGSSTPPGQGNGPLSGLQHVDQAPVVPPIPGGVVTEIDKITHSGTLDQASGIITFNDINVGDQPTVSATFDNYTYTDAHGNAMAANPLQLADVKATEVNLVVVQGPDNTHTGQAGWAYTVPDKAFDFLAAGETLTLTYIALVDSNYAPLDLKTPVPFTITITGTNDVPVITTGPESVEFFAAGKTTPGGNLAPSTPTTGTLAFTDVDLTDTHTVAPPQLTTATLSGSGAPNLLLITDGKLTEDGLALAPSPLQIFENALSATLASDSTGSGSGTINWTLADLPVYLADFIPKGETLTLTYTVTVTDSQNTTSTQNVIVTITGDNAPAVVWIETTDTVATDTAKGIVPGDWNAGTHWETGNVPTANDDTIIITNQLQNLTPFYPVTIDAPAFAKTLTMNDFGDTPPILDNNSTLTIGGTFDLITDAIVNNTGTISVGGLMEVENASQLTNSATLTLLQLAQGGDFKDQSIIKNNAGATIEVSGGALNVRVNIDNSGGFLQVDDGAALTLNGATVTGGTVTDNGMIHVTGDSAIDAAAVNGGQLTVDASATLTLDDTTVTGTKITDNGTVKVDATKTLTLQGGATVTGGALGNSGTVKVESSAGATLDGVKVTGSGNIQVDTNVIASTLVLDDGTTVTGGTLTVGSVGTLAVETAAGATLNDVGVTNNHSIEVFAGSNLTLDAGTAVTNDGTVTVDGTATLVLDSATINGGTLNIDGTLDSTGISAITNAGIHNTGTIEATSGILTIDPTVAVTFSNFGTIEANGGELDLIQQTVSNSGTLEAVNGSLLVLHNTTVNNTGGTVEAVDPGPVSISAVNLQDATINGGIVATIADGIINATGGTNAIDGAILNNAGTLEVTGGTLTIDAASTVHNTGVLEAIGGNLIVDTAFSGSAEIIGASLLELGADSASAYSSASISFAAAATGTLQLDHAKTFGGTVVGLDDNTLDLGDIAYGANVTASYAGTTAGGILSIFVGGIDVSNIHLSGDYTGVHWALADDGSSKDGTDVTEVPGAIAGLDSSGNAVEGTAVSVSITDGGQVVTGATYQWQLDGANIQNATGASYLPTESDEGHVLTVNVSYVDALSNTETSSASAGTVQESPTENASILLSGLTAGNAVEGTLVTATVNETDAPASGITYTWTVGGVAVKTGIDAAGATYTPTEADEGKAISVAVSFTDSHGFAEHGTTSAGTVQESPTENASILLSGLTAGNAVEGQQITVSVTETDAPATGITYTWTVGGVAVKTGTDAAGATYTPTEADEGKAISVAVSFTDSHGFAEHGTTSAGTVQESPTENASILLSGLTSGNAVEGTLVTATVNETDAPASGITYTWTVGGTQVKTGIDAAGATYTPTEADEGKTISVAVSFTDTNGFAEHGTTSAGTVQESPTENASISLSGLTAGNAVEGQQITVSVTETDAPATGITYTWTVGGVAVKTGTDAAGATYTPTEADEGKTISVAVSFTDTNGFAEHGTTSAGTVQESPTENASILLSGLTAGNAVEGQQITVSVTETDAPATGITYTWTVGGVAVKTGTDAAGATYTPTEADEGKAISVAVSFTDSHGFAEHGTTSAGTVQESPTENASISLSGLTAGNAVEGTLVTATVNETDAPASGITYTWTVGGTQVKTGIDAAGATYTPTEADEGKTISVAVSFTDSHGFAEHGTTSAGTVQESPTENASILLSGLTAGNAVEGTLVTATVNETDAPASGITYTWTVGGTQVKTGTDAAGATYTPTEADEGKTISVAVSFTDTNGFAEHGTTSAGTVQESPTENASILLSGLTAGNAVEGTLVTATVNETDAPATGITYTWTVGGTQVKTGTDAAGATYTPSEADEGKTISVAVTFTDTNGFSEHGTTSAGTVQESPTENASISLSGLIGGNAVEGRLVTATVTESDAPASGSIIYTWKAGGTTVASGLGVNTYTPTETDEGKALTVSVSFADTHGFAESGTTSAGTVQESATENASISLSGLISGNAVEGRLVTATVTESDAPASGSIIYTWKAGGTTVASGLGVNTYTPTETDEGKALTVSVSFADTHGFAESGTTSAGTVQESATGDLVATLDTTTAQPGVAIHVTGVTDGGIAVTTGLSYAWQHSSDNGQHWTTVGTNSSYTPGESDEGKLLQLVVTYAEASGTESATYSLGMPNDLVATLDGTIAEQGLTIHVTGVTDGGSAVSRGVSYAWQLSSDNGQHWTTVSSDSSYTPGATVVGELLQVVVNYVDSGENESTTDSLGIIAPDLVWKGDAHEWQTPGQWSPSGVPTSSDNALVDVSGTYKITVDQASSVAHSLVVNDSGATVEIVEGGALTLGGNLTIQAGKFQIDSGGILKDIAATATITGAFTDNGTIEAAGGILEIASTAISGAGKFKIDAGATLQFDHADSLNVAFTGSGTLVLKDPANFHGTISDSGGSLTAADVIDLAGFDTSAKVTYAGDISGGTVTVSEAGTSVTLKVGANSTHWNTLVSDGHGGILIHDPPDASAPTADGGAAPASGSLAVGGVVAIDPGPAPSTIVANAPNQTLTGSSASDTFVFNFIDVGHNTVTNFHPDTDTLQFSGTIFANPQAALNATQDDGHGNTVVALDAHDTITLTAVLKAQLHTADFHFV